MNGPFDKELNKPFQFLKKTNHHLIYLTGLINGNSNTHTVSTNLSEIMFFIESLRQLQICMCEIYKNICKIYLYLTITQVSLVQSGPINPSSLFPGIAAIFQVF